MKKFDVVIALEGLREARVKWGKARTEFQSGYDAVLTRLLHEAAANFMSAHDVATVLAVPPKAVRAAMRQCGLDSRSKTVLSQKAAEALANNSVLLGIEPHEMDLMSPLAYLPMGEKMKRELQDKTVSQVHEVSGNEGHYDWCRGTCGGSCGRSIENLKQVSENAYEALADALYDAMPWEGETYQAVAETLALKAFDVFGFCPTDGEPMPCLTCGAGL